MPDIVLTDPKGRKLKITVPVGAEMPKESDIDAMFSKAYPDTVTPKPAVAPKLIPSPVAPAPAPTVQQPTERLRSETIFQPQDAFLSNLPAGTAKLPSRGVNNDSAINELRGQFANMSGQQRRSINYLSAFANQYPHIFKGNSVFYGDKEYKVGRVYPAGDVSLISSNGDEQFVQDPSLISPGSTATSYLTPAVTPLTPPPAQLPPKPAPQSPPMSITDFRRRDNIAISNGGKSYADVQASAPVKTDFFGNAIPDVLGTPYANNAQALRGLAPNVPTVAPPRKNELGALGYLGDAILNAPNAIARNFALSLSQMEQSRLKKNGYTAAANEVFDQTNPLVAKDPTQVYLDSQLQDYPELAKAAASGYAGGAVLGKVGGAFGPVGALAGTVLGSAGGAMLGPKGIDAAAGAMMGNSYDPEVADQYRQRQEKANATAPGAAAAGKITALAVAFGLNPAQAVRNSKSAYGAIAAGKTLMAAAKARGVSPLAMYNAAIAGRAAPEYVAAARQFSKGFEAAGNVGLNVGLSVPPAIEAAKNRDPYMAAEAIAGALAGRAHGGVEAPLPNMAGDVAPFRFSVPRGKSLLDLSTGGAPMMLRPPSIIPPKGSLLDIIQSRAIPGMSQPNAPEFTSLGGVPFQRNGLPNSPSSTLMRSDLPEGATLGDLINGAGDGALDKLLPRMAGNMRAPSLPLGAPTVPGLDLSPKPPTAKPAKTEPAKKTPAPAKETPAALVSGEEPGTVIGKTQDGKSFVAGEPEIVGKSEIDKYPDEIEKGRYQNGSDHYWLTEDQRRRINEIGQKAKQESGKYSPDNIREQARIDRERREAIAETLKNAASMEEVIKKWKDTKEIPSSVTEPPTAKPAKTEPAKTEPAKTELAKTDAAPQIRTEIVDPSTIDIDPRMQYKTTGVKDKKNNVTDALKGTDTYDVDQGGVWTVFRYENGRLVAVNSHHRRELANRAKSFVRVGADGQLQNMPRQVSVRVLDAKDGWTPERARAYGALENIRDGKGTAADALDVMGELGINPEDFSKYGISMTGDMARNIQGLSALTPSAIGRVRMGDLPESVAAGIGSVKGLTPEAQEGAIHEAASRNYGTFDKGRDLGNEFLQDQNDGTLAQESSQGDLFGGEYQSPATSTRGIRVDIKNGVATELARAYNELTTPTRAKLRDGEKIDSEARRQEAAMMGESARAVRERTRLVLENESVKARVAQLAKEVSDGKTTVHKATVTLADELRDVVGKSVKEIVSGRLELRSGGAKESQEPTADTPGGSSARSPEETQGADLFGSKEPPAAKPAQEVSKTPSQPEGVAVSEPSPSRLDAIESDARAKIDEIKQRKKGVGITFRPEDEPELIAAYAKLGAVKIARGAVKFNEWRKQMIDEHGESIKTYLREIWKQSNEIHAKEGFASKDKAILYSKFTPDDRYDVDFLISVGLEEMQDNPGITRDEFDRIMRRTDRRTFDKDPDTFWEAVKIEHQRGIEKDAWMDEPMSKEEFARRMKVENEKELQEERDRNYVPTFEQVLEQHKREKEELKRDQTAKGIVQTGKENFLKSLESDQNLSPAAKKVAKLFVDTLPTPAFDFVRLSNTDQTASDSAVADVKASGFYTLRHPLETANSVVFLSKIGAGQEDVTPHEIAHHLSFLLPGEERSSLHNYFADLVSNENMRAELYRKFPGSDYDLKDLFNEWVAEGIRKEIMLQVGKGGKLNAKETPQSYLEYLGMTAPAPKVKPTWQDALKRTAENIKEREADAKLPLSERLQKQVKKAFGRLVDMLRNVLSKQKENVSPSRFARTVEIIMGGKDLSYRPEEFVDENGKAKDAFYGPLYSNAKTADESRGMEKPYGVAFSKSKPTSGRQTQSPQFKRWFGESKVVNEKGEPLVVHHGAPDVRGIFKEGFKPFSRGSAFFAAADKSIADTYADDRRAFDYQNAEPQTIPLYLSIKNPLIVDAKGQSWKNTQHYVDTAKENGHDGIIINNSRDAYSNNDKAKPTTVYVWFEPTQAKSAVEGQMLSRIDKKPIAGATGNTGKFDPSNPDITQKSQPTSRLERLEAIESRIQSRLSDRLKRELGKGIVMADPFGAMTAARFTKFLPDMAQLMAVKMAKGAVKFGDFANEAIKSFGEKVKPHLDKLYQEARSRYVSQYSQRNTPEEVKQANQAWQNRAEAARKYYENQSKLPEEKQSPLAKAIAAGNSSKTPVNPLARPVQAPQTVEGQNTPSDTEKDKGTNAQTAVTLTPEVKTETAKPTETKPTETKLTETKPTETVPAQNKVTAGANASTDIDRELMGIAKANGVEPETFGQWLQGSRDKKLNDPVTVARTAKEILEKPRSLSKEEQAGFTERLAVLKKEYQAARDAGAEPEVTEAIREQSAEILDALERSGTEAGRALVARKLAINDDLELTTVLYRAEKAKGGGKKRVDLTDTARETLTKRVEELEAYKTETEPKLAALQERQARAATNQAYQRRMKRTPADAQAKRQAAIDDLRGYLKETSGRTNAILSGADPVAAFKFGKVLKAYAEEGISNFDALLKRAQKDFPDAERSDIVQGLSANNPEPRTRAQINQELAMLKKEARRELASTPEKIAEREAAKIKSAQKSVDDLRNQLQTGNFTQSERVAKQGELKRLQDEKLALIRELYGNNKAARTTTPSAKENRKGNTDQDAKAARESGAEDRARQAAEKRIADLEEELRTGNFTEPVRKKKSEELKALQEKESSLKIQKNATLRIKELERRLREGDFAEAAPKVSREIDDQIKRIKDREKLLKAKVQAEIARNAPKSGFQNLNAFVGGVRLLNPINRAIDVLGNTTKLATYVASYPLRQGVDAMSAKILNAPRVERGMFDLERMGRIWDRTKSTMKAEAEAIMAGAGADSNNKFGTTETNSKTPILKNLLKIGDAGGKMAGLSDVPFSSFYRELAIDYGADLKAREMAGAGASKQDIADLRESIIRDIDNHPDIEMNAHEFALRETFNSQNGMSKALSAVRRAIASDPTSKNPLKDASVFIFDEFLARFTKVITNVATDQVDRTGWGAVRGGIKLAEAKALAESIPLDKRLQINELISKGLIGSALMVMGATSNLDDWLEKNGIGSVQGEQRKWLDYGVIGKLGGALAPMILGAMWKRSGKLNEEEARRLRFKTLVQLPINSPLATNAQNILTATESEGGMNRAIARKLIQMTPVTALRDFAAFPDRKFPYLDNGNDPQRERVPQVPGKKGMKNSDNFKDILTSEFKYNVPYLRQTLPIKGETEKQGGKSPMDKFLPSPINMDKYLPK